MVPVIYLVPPPSADMHQPPLIPPLSTLITRIVASIDRLFFISYQIGTADAREWRLVQVNLEQSMSLHPSYMQDGKFLVEFYIPRTSDIRYNGINQRYWLQYHKQDDLLTPTLDSMTHLIQPSNTSAMYAARNGLLPFRRWVTIIHESTYVYTRAFQILHSSRTKDSRLNRHQRLERPPCIQRTVSQSIPQV